MAFFDDLGKSISQASQDVMQKTKGATETIKLNSAISDEEKRIQGLYLEIGKAYFEAHADSYEPELESLILKVKESNTKIAAYNEQIKRLKGIINCPGCNKEIPGNIPFCTFCGTKIPQASADDGVRRCKNCGLPLDPGAAFCTNCGTPAPVEENVRRCAQCHTVLEEGALFCTNCGAKV